MIAAPGSLRVLTPREASIFVCLADLLVAAKPPLPEVSRSRAAFIFDAWLAKSPAVNCVALRGLLHVAEFAPFALGEHARLRRLSRMRRRAVIDRLARGATAGRGLLDVARLFATIGYYGDDEVSRQLGYDADAVVKRGLRLRAEQARP